MKSRNTKKKMDIPIKTEKYANRKKDYNKENKVQSKRNITHVNNALTKREEEQTYNLQLAVANSGLKRFVEKIKLDGLVEKLKFQIAKSALLKAEKTDKVAEAVGKRLQVEKVEKVTEERLQVAEKEKQRLNELYIVKNIEFQKKKRSPLK